MRESPCVRFLHCSDIHLVGDYASKGLVALGWRRMPALVELKLRGRGTAFARSFQSVQAITAQATAQKVDHLIVSGDLTGYALEEEFDAARAALGDWAADPQRCTVIPGNHDTYTPGALTAKRFERRFGHLLTSAWPEHAREGVFPFVHLFDEAAVVGLLSARVPFVPGCSFGVIGQRQLDGLDAVLADPRLGQRAVLVVVHHAPLNPLGRPDTPLHGLVDARALLERLPGPRHAVLHGHIHRRYHHPATTTRPHIFGAGSSTQAGREGYWLLDVKGGTITGEMRPLSGHVEQRA